jgi:hypothetical protein
MAAATISDDAAAACVPALGITCYWLTGTSLAAAVHDGNRVSSHL